ncbi:MAG: COX15/CtaA family protein [Chitinophagales bacterium]|nr:COX15/CtaA family protein [Chitinophagales bacterium]MCZ2393905.1 COX15/CtaA family protein [Chitinophagales bacterium]
MKQEQAAKSIRIWLIIGLIMVFVQILIGGVTRLTGSGLSITEWSVIMGTLPPLSLEQWNDAFYKYQQFDQFKLVNSHITLSDFKFIFFWEWFHRLWARSMGFVFLLPFIYFIFKGLIPKNQIIRYGILMILGGLAGIVGWIMVASGLEQNKVLVNPVKLMLHLLVACSIFVYLFRLLLEDTYPKERNRFDTSIRNLTSFFLILVITQIAIGALVAGSKAALSCTTWPLMNGAFVPDYIGFHTPFDEHVPENNLTIQFIHRMIAYFITVFSIYYYWRTKQTMAQPLFHLYRHIMLFFVFAQVALGIFTLINSKGEVPVALGALHQMTAFILLNIIVGLHYFIKYKAISSSSLR